MNVCLRAHRTPPGPPEGVLAIFPPHGDGYGPGEPEAGSPEAGRRIF